ncbi:PREDICTED: autophagy-related protein 18e-like [Camelina sativa]|uniref:Autophagy-related protein 18e-like n=1 Tax=Camelina sativa TaxID=90675 RepID=A0ABM0TDJ4_CAMSA|nr:PREDICTED: autophagy-related protein 18e-like [Camelina sativa]
MNSMISTVRGVRSILTLSRSETSDSPRDEAKGDLKVLSVAWNQDCSGFIVGTDGGFDVYSCNPMIKKSISRAPHESGFKTAEMLFLSNLFALVGNGYNNSKYPPNKLFVWDDHMNSCFCQLAFKSEVVAVKLTREHIVVVLKQNIYVYNFNNLKVYCLIETIMNPKGLCCVSHVETNAVLACPGFHPGQVQVHDLKRNVIKFIKAHDSALACMTLTIDGSLLPTASTKGTLIRVFNALDGTLLQEFRRGMERAEIYNVAISSNLKWVAASSEKGTLHVFRLRPDILRFNPEPSSSFIRGILPKYLYENERSFAQFSLPASTKFIVGFGSENTVLLVGMDGSFRRCRFDQTDGGQMVELEHKCFLSLQETGDTIVVI